MDFKLSNGFFDLCVNISNNDPVHLKNVLLRLHQMGYRTVALNQILHENVFDDKKKKKNDESKESSSMVPNPIDVSKLNKEFEGKLHILNRITFICSNSTKTHAVAYSANLKKYDLYAIAPTNDDMLQFACTQINADLITIRPSVSGVKMKRKHYQQAVERGLSFEIQYADLLKPETRKMAIYYAHWFYTYGRSMSVIVSSGAYDASYIRNPYDIINLGSLLGLSEEKSKAAILKQSQLLILRAERRRCGKAVFTVEFTEELTEESSEESSEEDMLVEECL
ncbi:PREDICTED: ribonuclease P protein subunit p30 [Dinoponera quadriceps]|uniref:Ribonuclease P protein subunit p30 n=1 Tax=Dinoponera quadriceps TaxID=609295 RepID=A0A6P3XVG8_DINQU|nr:PREDICTED: ribonuclease P protein subunit p30 [Dinoponera quadriceps]